MVQLLGEEGHDRVHQLEPRHQHQLEGGEGGAKMLRIRVGEVGFGRLQVDVAQVGVEEAAEAARHGREVPLVQILLHLRDGDGAAREDPAVLGEETVALRGRRRRERLGPVVRHDEEAARLPDLVSEGAGRLDDGQVEVDLSAADVVHAETVPEGVRAALWDAGGKIFPQALEGLGQLAVRNVAGRVTLPHDVLHFFQCSAFYDVDRILK